MSLQHPRVKAHLYPANHPEVPGEQNILVQALRRYPARSPVHSEDWGGAMVAGIQESSDLCPKAGQLGVVGRAVPLRSKSL